MFKSPFNFKLSLDEAWYSYIKLWAVFSIQPISWDIFNKSHYTFFSTSLITLLLQWTSLFTKRISNLLKERKNIFKKHNFASTWLNIGNIYKPVYFLDFWTILENKKSSKQCTWEDFSGAVEAILEDIAHVAEGLQPHPAGLDGARSGHSMALALFLQGLLNVLIERTKKYVLKFVLQATSAKGRNIILAGYFDFNLEELSFVMQAILIV